MRGRGEPWQSHSFTGCGKRESPALLKLPHFFKSDSVRVSDLFSAVRSREQAAAEHRQKGARRAAGHLACGSTAACCLTYNHQIQQGFGALPLLQLSLDVEGLPGLPGAARRGDRGGVLPVCPFGRGLLLLGCSLAGRGHSEGLGAPPAAAPVLPCAEDATQRVSNTLKTDILSVPGMKTERVPRNVEAHGLLLARDGHAGHFGDHLTLHFTGS